MKKNSLFERRPDLVGQWHPTKNGELTPNDVTYGSTKKVWWVCSKGHEWESTVNNRTKSRGSGCPYCIGKKVCEDNNLMVLMPDLAKEWHPINNGSLTPEDVTCRSNKRVWWVCEKGHKWEAAINNRVGKTCPYCSGKKVCADNCLATLRPDIAAEWHPTKNGNLTPSDVTCGSNKKVWWVCGEYHEWASLICGRVSGRNCPQCSVGPVSRISQRWLDSLGIPKENREILLHDLKIRVDGFVPETNTVYEFLGDYWHGNPARFDENKRHPVCGKTFGQLYNETKTRISRLKQAGVEVVYIWENDYRRVYNGR